MFLSKVTVRGFRAAADDELACSLPGRFSVLLGANSAGKTTVAGALYLAHPQRFPQLPPPSVSTLGPTTPREVEVEFEFGGGGVEGPLGAGLAAHSLPAPRWTRQLQRGLGRVGASTVGTEPDGFDGLRLIYLPALRNPVDELARREAQILVKLLRAEQQRRRGHRNLVDVRALAARLLERLTERPATTREPDRRGTSRSPTTSRSPATSGWRRRTPRRSRRRTPFSRRSSTSRCSSRSRRRTCIRSCSTGWPATCAG